jgi:hypothetical protein
VHVVGLDGESRGLFIEQKGVPMGRRSRRRTDAAVSVSGSIIRSGVTDSGAHEMVCCAPEEESPLRLGGSADLAETEGGCRPVTTQ